MASLRKRETRSVRRQVRLAFGRLLPWVYNLSGRRRYASRTYRCLEIGPGRKRIEGFEALNVVAEPNVDYVGDAARRLPFGDATFDVIYASHVLEHIPWYRVEEALAEWVRVLKLSGHLEIWVPDGLKVCKAFVDAELLGASPLELSPRLRFNPEAEPCKWAADRLFAYGDGTGKTNHPNWHRALFSRRYLFRAFESVGLGDIRLLDPGEVRGEDHPWINLGVRGTKPA